MSTKTIPIDSVVLGDRVRKDMGDIQELAESIIEHGLLHPIVITSDRKLVCGRRRLEAARLLGRTEIQYTEVSVENLLKAERDENEVRKDLLPSEKILIGRLIEEQEAPELEKRIKQGVAMGGRISGLVRKGELEGQMPSSSKLKKPQTRDVVGKAVGMGGKTYDRAKRVVEAAEAEPEKFGDLPQQMDDSGNVAGAFYEMRRRQGNGNGVRHPINAKTKHLKAEPAINNAINMLDGVIVALGSLTDEMLGALNEQQRADYSVQFISFARKVSKFGRRLA